MDYLWTPWRYRYLTTTPKDDGCVFCDAVNAGDDDSTLIVLRAKKNFIILNRYPYTSGHILIVPYAHQASLTASDSETLAEMMTLLKRAEGALQELYRPAGFNVGMNLGHAAGAGIAGHIHMHMLPRWIGDASFMTTVGETRVEPEELSVTYQRLRGVLQS